MNTKSNNNKQCLLKKRVSEAEFRALCSAGQKLNNMARLNINRQKKFEPIRMVYAKNEIEKLGYTVNQINDNELTFKFKRETVKFFSYSGWASGLTIQDSRGLDKLLKQIGVINERLFWYRHTKFKD